jgi:hypothetical protein
MSLSAGSITIGFDASGNPTYSGSGLALALGQARFAAFFAAMNTNPPPPPFPQPPYPTPYAAAAGIAAQAQIDATAICGWLLANAVITVPASGLDDSSGHPCSGTAAGSLT